VTTWLQIKKMTSYLRADKFKRYDEVPDPYFAAPGDQSGFDLVSLRAPDELLQTVADDGVENDCTPQAAAACCVDMITCQVANNLQ
jgi:hypothetical protein